ncbi:nucleoside hydrolase [Alistipes sp.]|uniref:nucleoside hydrolase n=1 Tax=Alistipes sp. TaxID=1872444 RepID=UPI003AEFE96D
MLKKLLPFAGAAALCLLCGAGCAAPEAAPAPLNVIFDTDMGNDIDDALALDMLYKYADEGRVRLLGITSCKEEPQSVKYLDVMNTFYGYPDLPIGRITEGAPCDRIDSFTRQIAADTSYARSVADYAKLPESVSLLRRLLAGQPDGETVLIAVGFSTNLARLLASAPDSFSPLAGRELVRRKVRHLYLMAGDFREPAPDLAEYNVRIDRDAARTVFDEWPTPLTASPFEVGTEICYPVESILRDFGYARKHPLAEAYKVYKPMPYDRPMWDPSAVLFAVEPEAGCFTPSVPGRIRVGEDSQTRFEADPAGTHRYLKVDSVQAVRARRRIVELVTRRPNTF